MTSNALMQTLIVKAYISVILILAGMLIITLYLDSSSYLSRGLADKVATAASDGLKVSIGAALGALSVLLSKTQSSAK